MGLKFRFDDDVQTYDQALARIKNSLGDQFRMEAMAITAGLEERNYSKVASGVCAIHERYNHIEKQLKQLQKEKMRLEAELKQTKEILNSHKGKITPPATRPDLIGKEAEMYELYKQLNSFRAVGMRFNCHGKTVSTMLRNAGYCV